MTVDPFLPFFAASDDQGLRLAESAAAQVEATLRVATALATSGRRVDLGGLELEVGRLCAGLLDLPPALGHAMRPRLTEVLAALDRLATVVEPS